MNLTWIASSTRGGRFGVAGVLGALVLVCAACSSGSDATAASPGSGEEGPASAAPGGEPAAPAAPAPAGEGAAPATPAPSGEEGVTPVALDPGTEEAPPAAEPEPGTEETPAPAEQDPSAEEPPAAEEPDPSEDENLAFILEDGFETTYFAVHCSAIGEDGTEIDGDTATELPVGGGFVLQCNLDRFPSRATTDVLSAANEPWCALGELQSSTPEGDERLSIVLTSAPDAPSPTLIATSAEPITLQQASVFGAPVWPVWLVTSYDAVEVARAEQGKLCDEIFGL